VLIVDIDDADVLYAHAVSLVYMDASGHWWVRYGQDEPRQLRHPGYVWKVTRVERARAWWADRHAARKVDRQTDAAPST
jgi:hypothetical protein